MALRPERIKQRRESLGYSLQQLADRCGLSRGFVHAIETGRASPSISSLSAIAAALGVSISYLTGETDDPFPPRPRTLSDIAEELRLRGLSENDIQHVLDVARLREMERRVKEKQ